MLMCVHLSAQDRHRGARLGKGVRGVYRKEVCVPELIAGHRTALLSGCLPDWLVGSAARFDPLRHCQTRSPERAKR